VGADVAEAGAAHPARRGAGGGARRQGRRSDARLVDQQRAPADAALGRARSRPRSDARRAVRHGASELRAGVGRRPAAPRRHRHDARRGGGVRPAARVARRCAADGAARRRRRAARRREIARRGRDPHAPPHRPHRRARRALRRRPRRDPRLHEHGAGGAAELHDAPRAAGRERGRLRAHPEPRRRRRDAAGAGLRRRRRRAGGGAHARQPGRLREGRRQALRVLGRPRERARRHHARHPEADPLQPARRARGHAVARDAATWLRGLAKEHGVVVLPAHDQGAIEASGIPVWP
jgi:hypothetical protein